MSHPKLVDSLAIPDSGYFRWTPSGGVFPCFFDQKNGLVEQASCSTLKNMAEAFGAFE